MHTPGIAHARPQKRSLARLRPTLLAAAMCAIGLQISDAEALGLGGLKVRSAIGEPFRAEVALIGSGESLPASTCFTVDAPSSINADELPWLGGGRLRVQGRTLHISSGVPINEPILMVGIRVACGFEVSRDYTVLMQPMGSTPEDVAVQSEQAARADLPADTTLTPPRTGATPRTEPALQTGPRDSAAAPPARPRAARIQKRTDRGVGDRLFVAPGADSNGLKMSGGMAQRPAATEAQRDALRSEQKLLAALDEQIATHLAIADKVKHLEARLSELQKQLDRSSATLDAAQAPKIATSPAEPAAPTPVPQDAAPVTSSAANEPVLTPPAETADAAPPTPAPPPGLSNEPAKVITKLPPDSPPDDVPPELPGVDWMVAGLGLAAAGAVLGGGWLWRRRTAQQADLKRRRQLELEARLAEQQSVRRRDERAADTDFSQSGQFRPSDTLPASAAMPSSPVTFTPPASSPQALVDKPRSTYELRPAEREDADNSVQAVASIDFFPGEAPAEHMEGMEITAAPDSTRSPSSDTEKASDTPPAARPDLEFSPASVASVDFELSTDSGASESATPARLDLEFDTFTGSTSTIGSDASDTRPRLVSSQTTVPAGNSVGIDQTARPANEEDPPSHEHVLELAEIMMSFGRAEGAAQTLSDFLRDYPKESLVPWLKLLDLYHKSGRRGEYDDLAPKLNRAFNVKVPAWEEFTGPTTSESVEQFAHIMARVNATWPGQECLDYLTELLRDNRAGARIGFPLGVIDDILLLKSMLEWLTANPPMVNTSASRLAQL